MNPTPINAKAIIPKALLLSFLLHWAVFDLFIFVVPLRMTEESPRFIFLGSILKQQNLSSAITGYSLATKDFNKVLTKSVDKKSRFTGQDFSDPKIQKPSSNNFRQYPKKQLKTTFLPENDSGEKGEGNAKENIGMETTPYIPLRFHFFNGNYK